MEHVTLSLSGPVGPVGALGPLQSAEQDRRTAAAEANMERLC